MSKLRFYLLLDHIVIQGANAISSPLTYGFPAITGFLGAIHALSRKLTLPEDAAICLDGVLLACHQCDVQTYRADRFSDYNFKLTRNPLAKNGETRSIIEEGKVHLEVSLVVEVLCHPDALSSCEAKRAFERQVSEKLMQQRIAGGSVFAIGDVKLYDASSSDQILISRLIPAFVLMEAKDTLLDITDELQQQDPEATMLDAILATARLDHHPQDDDTWRSESINSGRGWVVPIPLGYQAISPRFDAGTVLDTRDRTHAAQFVECLYGLGRWIFPYDLSNTFNNAFWRYAPASKQNHDAGLYLVTQESFHSHYTM